MSDQHTRKRLPDTRSSITHKFVIQSASGQGEFDGYLTVGFYASGDVGEIFLHTGKQGGTFAGLCDSYAIMMSLALQYGVPVPAIVDKFRHVNFEPQGETTGDRRIERCSSIVDYVAQWLGHLYWGEHLVDRCERTMRVDDALGTSPIWICPPDCPVEARGDS